MITGAPPPFVVNLGLNEGGGAGICIRPEHVDGVANINFLGICVS